MGEKSTVGTATRTIGRNPAPLRLRPSGDALRAGIKFVEEFRGFGPAKIWFPKGLYRYRTHEEMNRADDERIAQALADSIVRGSPGGTCGERE